jgi:two-component system, NtrC family, response regulator HydG
VNRLDQYEPFQMVFTLYIHMTSKLTNDTSFSTLQDQVRASDSNSANVLKASSAPNALAERIKELNCLYGISNLLENQDVSLSWIMQRAVELIPAAWQYPENASARIRLGAEVYASSNFQESRWRQNEKIILNGEHLGDLDVCYTHSPPENDIGPFLEEERRLLRAISERLSKVLWLKQSEEALKESEERYRVLTEQVAEGVALVQNGRFYYVNPAFCRMFNIPSARAIQGGPVHNPPAGEVEAITCLYGGGAGGFTETKTEEIHQLTLGERTYWIQVCHNPITFRGRPAILSTFKDITDIKEKQVAAESMADMLNRENRVLRSSLKERYRLGDILGRSPAMQEVYELILKAAATNASVAIFGESGSGKELVAHAIHENSGQKDKRFIAVNCSAVQESLFEREFFGHRKGAFSSAHADSPGYLDMADGGTLFLDEVSELTLNMQAKLLRAIEGCGYRPVGSMETHLSDFKTISASNAPLGDKVASGQMREDFFYRIQVIQIRLPPLRHRKQDIPLLVEHFLQKLKAPCGMETVPGRIMDILVEYEWPGNVRELRNVLQRFITLGHLEFLSTGSASKPVVIPQELNLRKAIHDLEKGIIATALKQAGGNRTRAAALLGISRRALFRKMPPA